MLLFLLLSLATATPKDAWGSKMKDLSDQTMVVRSGLVKCYKAFFSTGCSGEDTIEAECDTCFGQACFKIGGRHEGVEAYNYGCVERYSSSLASRCVSTLSAGTPGVACYCWDDNFCNSASLHTPSLLILALAISRTWSF